MKRKIYQKEFYVIGHLLWRTDRQAAEDLISTYIRPKQKFDDFTIISLFFMCFCDVRKIHHSQLTGILYKSTLTKERRLFISCMIRLYNSQIYGHPSEAMIIRIGFSGRLARVLQISQTQVSKLIKTCVIHEKVYEETRNEVTETVALLEKMYQEDPEGRGVEQSG